MESNIVSFPWLEFINHPAFCVKDGYVLAANSAAQSCMIISGMEIDEIIGQNRDAYDSFQGGNLFLTITAGGLSYNACVTRTDDCDIFTITQTREDSQLQTLALAAQQLRIPLSNMITVTDRLLTELNPEDSTAKQQISQINRNIFRLLRIIGNMSDANNYENCTVPNNNTINFTSLFEEIMEKIQTTSNALHKKLSYTGLDSPVLGLGDEEKLTRAIYNLLSNALKFSPDDSTIDARLTQNRNILSFTVSNQNSEAVEDYMFHNRYTRKPSIEDDRFGLGLGMTLISSIACAHGGTVLVDHPLPNTTRVTMTIAIKNDNSGIIRSPILRIGDYAGGRDKGLLELSEILPADIYNEIN